MRLSTPENNSAGHLFEFVTADVNVQSGDGGTHIQPCTFSRVLEVFT